MAYYNRDVTTCTLLTHWGYLWVALCDRYDNAWVGGEEKTLNICSLGIDGVDGMSFWFLTTDRCQQFYLTRRPKARSFRFWHGTQEFEIHLSSMQYKYMQYWHSAYGRYARPSCEYILRHVNIVISLDVPKQGYLESCIIMNGNKDFKVLYLARKTYINDKNTYRIFTYACACAMHRFYSVHKTKRRLSLCLLTLQPTA